MKYNIIIIQLLIGSLTMLEELNLKNNILQSIPSVICNLERLQILTLGILYYIIFIFLIFYYNILYIIKKIIKLKLFQRN